MRYWWVSQNQTFSHEVYGGYLWSPKANSNGSVNHFYETMREVSRGDLIFSFCDRKIMALGFAMGTAYTCPKPSEFGSAGTNWNQVGWRVDVAFQVLQHPIEPRAHMNILGKFLPERYSPIRQDGTGNQMYLAEISKNFGQALSELIGIEAQSFLVKRAEIVSHPEKIEKDPQLVQTEKEQVIKSRRGQGIFRNRVAEIENHCRVTNVDEPEHLIASHIKPWRVSSNNERLDGENGLLLTPSIDHLFDHGYISFRDNGALLVSPTARRITLAKMGVPKIEDFNVGVFTRLQAQYLEYHRDSIFLKARA